MCGAGKRTGLALRLGLLADAGGGVGISAVGTAHGIEVEVAHFRRRDLLGTLRAAVAEVVGGEFVFGAAHTRQYRAKKRRRFTQRKGQSACIPVAQLRVFGQREISGNFTGYGGGAVLRSSATTRLAYWCICFQSVTAPVSTAIREMKTRRICCSSGNSLPRRRWAVCMGSSSNFRLMGIR